MKKCLFAAIAALLIALPLSASTRPAPGKFGVKGEWIYFYPAIEDTYFVLQGDSNGPQGEKQNNLWNYTSGYRVEGIYSFCNCINDLRLRWTQLLKKTHTANVNGTNLYATELPPNVAAFSNVLGETGSEISMEYYAAEAMLGQLIYDCSPFSMEFEIGIQYGHVKYLEGAGYYNSRAAVLRVVGFKDTMNGIGPEMAFDGDYSLYCCDSCCPGTLYLTSSLRGALLISDSKAELYSANPTASSEGVVYAVADKKDWRVVPWWDMRLGLNYAMSCFDCFSASVEVGYEAGCYVNAISKERFVDTTAAGASFNQFQDFSYHGPYVAVEVMF